MLRPLTKIGCRYLQSNNYIVRHSGSIPTSYLLAKCSILSLSMKFIEGILLGKKWATKSMKMVIEPI